VSARAGAICGPVATVHTPQRSPLLVVEIEDLLDLVLDSRRTL
jgi:hypothetical protein